ncbi:MAG: sigma-70 family RNA polymerase sigma factor [Planctomycetaceae bacterium]|nr:sigma-70 family RNA polymerase sigma factor [Planctomycetaceae bacterium]
MTRGNSPPDLGARLRAGDEDVLEVILRTHGPPILALLRQRFVGPLTATDFEDVLAAALFRIWQHRARFDPSQASLRVWFFRIAENLARDVLKHGWHKARQLELSTEPLLLAEAIDRRRPNGESDMDAGDGELPTLRVPLELLRELLASLPENQRRIVLADADSRDGVVASHDLASELGIPPSTVRVYRRRALERLRREIEERELAARSIDANV